MSSMPEMPDAIILCGGAGLRLKSVTGDSPKVMAAVSGRPFLELLLQQLKRAGCERVIFAVGYRADVIQAYFGRPRVWFAYFLFAGRNAARYRRCIAQSGRVVRWRFCSGV